MKSYRKILVRNWSAIALLCVIFQGTARADLFSSLSPDEQDALQRGDQVVKTDEIEGSVWPKITVYQIIDVPNEEMAAVMFDYSMHKEIFEGIIKSSPQQTGSVSTDVDYEMTFPKVMGISLPNEVYTVKDQLSSTSAAVYEVNWSLVRASSMKNTYGGAHFESFKAGTLVAYTSFIDPPRPSLAKLIIKMAIDRVKDSVKALAKRVQAERSGDRSQLNLQLALMKKALGQ